MSTPFPRDPLSTARRQHDALVDLARRPSLHAGRLPVALREIAEKAAETLDVERIGIWFFTPDCRAIRCTELFERTPAVHSDGGELTALRYPVYFKALESERTINASDARLDPRTSAFKEAYLDPYGVMSMLDAPIRRLGSTTGCFEHTGSLRNWSSEEEHFASSISDLVAMAMDASDRRMTQEALRHRVEFETLIAAISTRFANASEDEIDAAMHDALADIGGFVGADRCITILLDRTDLAGRMMHRGDLRLRPGAPAHVRRAQRERAAASPSLRAQPGRRLSEHGRGPDSRVQRCHGQHARLRLARRVPPAQCPRPLLQSPRTGRVRRARPPRRRHSRNRDLSAAEGQLAVVGPGERAHGRRCDGRNHRRHHGPQACRDRSARQRGPLSPHGGELDRPHRPHHAGRHFSLRLRRVAQSPWLRAGGGDRLTDPLPHPSRRPPHAARHRSECDGKHLQLSGLEEGRLVRLVRVHQPGRPRCGWPGVGDHLGLARHQRAQAGRGADRVSGLPRRADRVAEPAPLPRPADHRIGPRPAPAVPAGGDVPRPGPLQDRQRHPRSQPRRRHAARDRRPAPLRPARRGHDRCSRTPTAPCTAPRNWGGTPISSAHRP